RIFSSSGTTGVPKFAAVSHAMMLERVYLRSLVARVPAQPRVTCSISGGTNIGFGTFLQALWQRGSVVLMSQQDNVGAVLERHRPNVLVTAPVTLQQLVAMIPAIAGPMRGLETVIAAGSALSDGLYDIARQRLCPYIVSLYGSVEAGAIASAPKNVLYQRAGAAGYVLPGLEMQAVNEQGEALRAGEEGLIRIRGATCIEGYFGDPASSASVFRDGWFYPGDTGSISADGLLTLGARASEVINSGGNKISPQVIEELLMSVPGIRDAAAFGLADPMGVTRVWAAIATYDNAPPDHNALDAKCRQHLAAAGPSMFIQVPQIPRNENGKILRDELRRIATAAMQRQRQVH
ncbi:MAG TPA: fatty acid--CoA ligase family protein, partial [Casimicrobiaceae bacterium]|nr:fatty acid--CoA ligase family protein [Casimicrobiaceae bacterium]